MREVKYFACDYCGTEYENAEDARKCEKVHKIITGIKSQRYISYIRDAGGLPASIEVTYKDGDTTKTATYNHNISEI